MMRKHELSKLGVPNSCLDLAVDVCKHAASLGKEPADLLDDILATPNDYLDNNLTKRFAQAVIDDSRIVNFKEAPYKVWGEDQIDNNAVEQMRTALRIPVAVKGAMMPDAHLGYGLPVGGVLATANAVVPYAVGVDIACRMKLTVMDFTPAYLERHRDRFEEAINKNTLFGVGQDYTRSGRKTHDVMDKDWSVSPITEQHKDTAWKQLGTSGSGNHFVEFGVVEFTNPPAELEGCIEKGRKYVGLMSHSGSRGTGSKVCDHYSKLAMKLLPKGYEWAKHLAWLYLDTQEGQEYWNAMNLMGDYAAANHDIIHRQIVKHLGAASPFSVENHHNFAWKENHDGIDVVVHRKGATPAGVGVYGVIPGSMADPAYIVRGLGDPSSLTSASHGAGRKKGRRQARDSETWDFWKPELKRRGVHLISSGIDEVPSVYKPIGEVMARQQDLVEIIARFQPKIVKMADDGSSED